MADDQYIEIQQDDLKGFLRNPENQKTATALALQLRDKFGRRWFTLSDVKGVAINAETIESFELPVLKAYNLLRQKNNKYRITLAVLERIKQQQAEAQE